MHGNAVKRLWLQGCSSMDCGRLFQPWAKQLSWTVNVCFSRGRKNCAAVIVLNFMFVRSIFSGILCVPKGLQFV
jgi:hypothetical protein